MPGTHRETAAERRWTGSAVLAGTAPRRGARPALRKLWHVPISRQAGLPAVSVGDIRMACGRADLHHRDVGHFSLIPLRRSLRALYRDPGGARVMALPG